METSAEERGLDTPHTEWHEMARKDKKAHKISLV